jgi:hypothetical protein
VADIFVIVYDSPTQNPAAISNLLLWKPPQDTSTATPQVEAQPHFIGRFNPSIHRVLPWLRQNSASDAVVFFADNTPNFLGKFQPVQFTVPVALRQPAAADAVVGIADNTPGFTARYRPIQFNILQSLRQQTDFSTTGPIGPQIEAQPHYITRYTQPQFNILISLRQQTENVASSTPPIRGQWRLLSDHYVVSPSGTSVYHNAGDVITEGVDVPIGWPPTLASEPLNSEALQQYWNLGPIGMNDAEPQRDFYNVSFKLTPPLVKWVRIAPNLYQLTGAGAILGPKGIS